MSARLKNVDRKTPLLLPPALQDWLPEDDLAHFILEALEEMDLSAAVLNERGTGDEQYPPLMMLAVLIYSYAHGIMSSRQIERSTWQNLSVRYLCGNLHPDHDTLCTFRRRNRTLLLSIFVQLLQLAKRSGLLQVGTVAIDGTKIEAAAHKRHTRTRAALEQEIEQLELQVETLLQRAETADAHRAPDPGAEHLPQELAQAQARRRKLQKAHAELRAQIEELNAAQQAQREDPQRPPGARARPPAALAPAHQKVNLSDPQSTLTPSVKGFIQGYNAQIIVECDDPRGLILAADVVRDTSDQQQLEPMFTQAVANLGEAPKCLLGDAGFENFAQSERLRQRYGLELLIPPVPNAGAKPETGRGTPWERTRRRRRAEMAERLQEPATRARYQRRGATVEPVFGTLKTVLRLRRFQGRGLTHVRNEWTLACLAFNCRRLVARRTQKK